MKVTGTNGKFVIECDRDEAKILSAGLFLWIEDQSQSESTEVLHKVGVMRKEILRARGV